MKHLFKKTIISSQAFSLFVALALATTIGCATSEPRASEAKLTRAQAENIALARVPNGMVKKAELEKEHGVLIWSVDILQPGKKDITEIHVNANTGEIARVEHED